MIEVRTPVKRDAHGRFVGTPFWDNVDQSGECWKWMAHHDVAGYGRVVWNRKVRRAHRVAWELIHGPIPVGMWVLHRCDNPPCVNPAHLFLGTHADNMADMAAKGHRYTAPGERNGRARLTIAQVREIRASRAPHVEMAALFGVSDSAIQFIRARVTWRDVT